MLEDEKMSCQKRMGCGITTLLGIRQRQVVGSEIKECGVRSWQTPVLGDDTIKIIECGVKCAIVSCQT